MKPAKQQITKPVEAATFRDRIAILIEKAGSQSALARQTGCPQGQIGHFFRGEREPVLSTLLKLAHGAGVTVAWLVGEEAFKKAA